MDSNRQKQSALVSINAIARMYPSLSDADKIAAWQSTFIGDVQSLPEHSHAALVDYIKAHHPSFPPSAGDIRIACDKVRANNPVAGSELGFLSDDPRSVWDSVMVRLNDLSGKDSSRARNFLKAVTAISIDKSGRPFVLTLSVAGCGRVDKQWLSNQLRAWLYGGAWVAGQPSEGVAKAATQVLGQPCRIAVKEHLEEL